MLDDRRFKCGHQNPEVVLKTLEVIPNLQGGFLPSFRLLLSTGPVKGFKRQNVHHLIFVVVDFIVAVVVSELDQCNNICFKDRSTGAERVRQIWMGFCECHGVVFRFDDDVARTITAKQYLSLRSRREGLHIIQIIPQRLRLLSK